nr:hypothetical protein GCM10020092_007400 [Actinoplanes digitatis]
MERVVTVPVVNSLYDTLGDHDAQVDRISAGGAGGAVGSTLFVAAPALAHGYVSSPPSRQALCASGAVANCGQIQFEPQSVEGPKGLKSCDGGVAGFSVLADESRNWLSQGGR